MERQSHHGTSWPALKIFGVVTSHVLGVMMLDTEKYTGCVVPCLCAMCFSHGFPMWKCSFPLSPGKKLHGMCLCPESPGDHSADGGPAQSAPAGYCQNLPEWERLRYFWEVWSNLQHAHPVLDISLHCYSYNSMRPAVSNHRDAQVRTQLRFFKYFCCACCHCACIRRGCSNAAKLLQAHIPLKS